MSALDGYRQYAAACHVMPNTVGKHVTVVVALADAAIAELEAELEHAHTLALRDLEDRKAMAAELAALKARRCETCRSQEEGLSYCSTLDVLTTEGFYCADWEARR